MIKNANKQTKKWIEDQARNPEGYRYLVDRFDYDADWRAMVQQDINNTREKFELYDLITSTHWHGVVRGMPAHVRDQRFGRHTYERKDQTTAGGSGTQKREYEYTDKQMDDWTKRSRSAGWATSSGNTWGSGATPTSSATDWWPSSQPSASWHSGPQSAKGYMGSKGSQGGKGRQQGKPSTGGMQNWWETQSWGNQSWQW